MPEANGDEVVAARLTPDQQRWLENWVAGRAEGQRSGEFLRMLAGALPKAGSR